MADKRINAVVHGRVQGVFFRDCTREEALRLGLTGWVRNLATGSVETEFQGEEQQVESMLAWLSTGSPMALVSGVDWQLKENKGLEEAFVIRY